MISYAEFLKQKDISFINSGFSGANLNTMLFDFQATITQWALRKGRAAVLADCGLGKSPMQLEWANQVNKYTNKPILILAPLAVSKQTKREGEKFGIDVNICDSQKDVKNWINITNYEKLHKFDANKFVGVVLDESSILKSYSGKIRNQVIGMFAKTPYKLACTATPSPNDYMELGNHSEFLGVMTRSEMLSMFFIHDGGDTAKWRLKGHAEGEFWKWLCSWAVMIRKPSDLGFNDNNFILPDINYYNHTISATVPAMGQLFPVNASTLMERRQIRREFLPERCERAAEIINSNNNTHLVWCDLNDESALLTKLIDGAIEVKGADSIEHKEKAMLDFSDNKIKCLVTKPKIAGFGMNWQNSHNMSFVGLSDSYEAFYQAVRREWRFGQKSPVNVNIITHELEGEVLKNIQRKDNDAQKMANNMLKHMADISSSEIRSSKQTKTNYNPSHKMEIPAWM